jgi:hypothetical protein
MEPYPLDLEYVVDLERDERIADELTAIRERGLEDLYAPTGGQRPKSFPELQPRADAFARALHLPAFGPTATMSAMLKAVVSAYARWGNVRQSQILFRLFFDPKGTPPRHPRERLKAARAYAKLDDKRFYEKQRILFRDLAPFLDAFVTAAIREAATPATQAAQLPSPSSDESENDDDHEEQDADDDGVAAAAPPPPRGNRFPALLALVLAAGLVATTLVVVILQSSPGPSADRGATPITISGYIDCWPDASKPVEGVWIAAPSGGSGWATWHALPGRPNVAWFSHTLPNGGSYVVDAGCGGTSKHWEVALSSITTVQGSGYYFTCYDVPSSGGTAQLRCQP